MDINLFDKEVKLLEKLPTKVDKEHILIIKGGNNALNRQAVSNKFLDILLDPHIGNRKDFMHHRDSGLNQVLCKLAKENRVAIGFSLSTLLKDKNLSKSLGRIIQNIKLCKKYGVKIVVGNFTTDQKKVRHINDIHSLFKLLGSTSKDLKQDFVKERLDFKQRYIKKGVMLAAARRK